MCYLQDQRNDRIRRQHYGRVRAEGRIRRNHEIRVPTVRLIDQLGEQVGVIDKKEALRLAETAGLDLVEIKPEVDPPVCKIMDFGRYKYELSKKKSAATKAGKSSEPKDIRLGRGASIGSADLERRILQAREFLMDGHPVNFIQRFRGREMAHPEIGRTRLERVRKELEDISKLQNDPTMNGRQMNMMLVPDKVRIEAIKQRAAAKADVIPRSPDSEKGTAGRTDVIPRSQDGEGAGEASTLKPDASS